MMFKRSLVTMNDSDSVSIGGHAEIDADDAILLLTTHLRVI